MLEKINQILSSMPGLGPCQVVPHLRLSSDELKKHKVFLLDDSPGVFEIYVPPLMAATDGNAQFMLHDYGDTISVVVDAVKQASPTIVLIDFYLAGEIRGSDVCAQLSKEVPESTLFGFSSIGMDPRISKAFIDAGAKASIHKTKDAERTIESILSWLS